MEQIFYIVYKTTNIINGKIYIGVHKTTSLKFDGYLGCGVYVNDSYSYKRGKTHFQCAVNKYGVNNFKREILKTFNNEIDALDLEAWLVTEKFVKDSNTYNMERGGGYISKPLNSKKVFVYNEFGKLEQSFESQSDASRYIYGNPNNTALINRAIKSGTCCKKYQIFDIPQQKVLSYEDKKKSKYMKMNQTMKKYDDSNPCKQFAKSKKVGQYTLDGKLVKIWDSQTQCCKIGKFTNVQGVLEGKRAKCKGFTFKWIEN